MKTNIHYRKKERGMVLIVTMLVLTAMLFIASALMRSSDTSLFAVGNMSFQQRASASIHAAVEDAMQRIASRIAVDKTLATPIPSVALNRLPTDTRGIPNELLPGTPFGGNVLQMTVDNIALFYTIEQMCVGLSTMPPSKEYCVLNSSTSGLGAGPSSERAGEDGTPGIAAASGSIYPIFRVTVRANGEKNTVVFAQFFLHF